MYESKKKSGFSTPSLGIWETDYSKRLLVRESAPQPLFDARKLGRKLFCSASLIEELQRTSKYNSRTFQPYSGTQFRGFDTRMMRSEASEKSKITVRIAVADLIGTALSEVTMNARPEIREKLIEQKLRRWSRIAKWHPIDSRCSPARARKNYWRLCAKYPHIMRRLGLSEISVYQ